MYKRSISLLAAGLLVLCLSALAQVQLAVTQDCSVQILSVTLSRSTLSVGETLQVNVSYSLLYDPQDPLAIGVVSMLINAVGDEQPVLTREYLERGSCVKKTTSVVILPGDWEPKETGQIGFVRVSGWVQDSYGSMTDYVEKDFRTERSEAQLTLDDLPSGIVFHDQFILRVHITNAYNSSIVLDNHPVRVEISNAQEFVLGWDMSTSTDGTASQTVETDSLGTGTFMCNITSKPSGDYLQTSAQSTFDVANANILLVTRLNATAYLTYYPRMSNCTALITADLVCSSQMNDVSETNVTWTLAGKQGVLRYIGGQQFGGEVPMPDTAGNYMITIQASLPNHNSTQTTLPLVVESREPSLSLTANRTQAAHGDFIGLRVRAVDEGCSRPVAGKQVSVYLSVQTDWVLLACAALDDNGELSIAWQAQDIGNSQEFCFKAIFQGLPEFDQVETVIGVENTGTVRFLTATRFAIARGRPANFTIQITTLESAPIPNLDLFLVEALTNQTWCSATTNASGYAYLVWNTPGGYELGEHEFRILAEDTVETQGGITVFLDVCDATVLMLV